jgi:hypothetical protein
MAAPGYDWQLDCLSRTGCLIDEVSILERYEQVVEPYGEFGGVS